MALGLSACAETTRPAPATADKTITPTVAALAAEKPMPALAAEKPMPALAAEKQMPAMAPEKPVAPSPPQKEYPPLSYLSGLDPDQVTGLLGTPGFKRLDDPALIWQYRSPACALDLFLYRSGKQEPYKVLHFETRSRGNVALSEKACFVGLLKAHEQRS